MIIRGDFMAEIQLRNLSKRWGTFVGVEDFNLTIADQEFLVLLGPSGCGKTTTMRMIAGLEDVTGGDILIDGVRVNDLDPKDRDVAMVFQSYALYPNMNVYENIRFPLKVRKIPEAEHEERVMRASAMVELDDFLHRKPAELSGGQRQRVALARAIVREPNVFLMDEPLSNLDAKLRVSTRAQIKNLSHELKVTTIYVTHDQIEAMTLADRVVVLRDGLIEQVGSPLDLYDHPVNQFVAQFIGTPQMNVAALQTLPSAVQATAPSGTQGGSMGLRPESVSITSATEGIPASVVLIEALGAETLIYAKTAAGAQIVSRQAQRTAFKVGEQVGLQLDLSHAHWFDANGRTVSNPA